jgi:hypothetical protein
MDIIHQVDSHPLWVGYIMPWILGIVFANEPDVLEANEYRCVLVINIYSLESNLLQVKALPTIHFLWLLLMAKSH